MSAEKLEQAQAAIKRGERIHARKILREILVENPRQEEAWLLMARVVDTEEQVVDCLERALRINPANQTAARGLQALRHRQLTQREPSQATPPQPPATFPAGLERPVPSKSTAGSIADTQPVRVATETASSLPVAIPQSAQPLPLPVQRPPARSEVLLEKIARKKKEKAYRPAYLMVNWTLLLGTLIVLFVIFIAIAGPMLAPGDPLEENVIIKVGSKWVIPPFDAFEVPGFPLGSDQFGRNLLSRVLWAVRPTMVMVAIVALVRLVLGTVIGLGAGWSSGRLGRALDTVISSALAIPVLMVALGAIAMLGAVGGNLLVLAVTLHAPTSLIAILKAASNSTLDQLLPFVVGLSINGWGETARIVREQTQGIKNQLYIEAAHALGASSLRVLCKHVLRQIMPMVWMLFAFEISSTLMVTAGLGFLGYYIGGDVWIEVADFVSRRTSGTPELGQMLATSWSTLTEPWPMVLTGTVIFLSVLGFNLMGEGLRTRLDPEKTNRNSLFARTLRDTSAWLEENLTYPITTWLKKNGLRIVLSGVFIATFISVLIWLRGLIFTPQATPLTELSVPGGHFWAGERHDPYGTRWSPAKGPTDPHVLWKLTNPAGFSGAPAINGDGIIYLVTNDSRLLALNPDGSTLWETALPEAPVDTPALGADGNIYIAEKNSGLMMINPNGQFQWHFQNSLPGQPTHGPVIDSQGNIYYLLEEAQRGDTLVSLAPGGAQRWSAATTTTNADSAPRLSPDEKEIFIKNVIFRTSDGSLKEIDLPTLDDPVLSGREQLFVGADGRRYLLAGHYVMQWSLNSSGFLVLNNTEWNYQGAGLNQYSTFPSDAGVTLDQTIWLFYTSQYGGTFMAWLDPDGQVKGMSYSSLAQNTQLAAVDSQETAYLCGVDRTVELEPRTACQAYNRGSAELKWELVFDTRTDDVIGASLTPGRLYVTTKDGNFFALGDEETVPAATAVPTTESTPTTAGQTASSSQTPTAEVTINGSITWSFQVPEAFGGLMNVLEDGSITILSEGNTFYRLNPQGELVQQVNLQPGPYIHPDGRYIIVPRRLPDGSLLVFSAEQSVYLLDPQGQKRWEVKLGANPAGPPEFNRGSFYLADLAGSLYAFNSEGLAWQFSTPGAEKATTPPMAGMDGSIYYGVIVNNQAYIQAVTPKGASRWLTRVQTGFIYDWLQINQPGTLVFQREDIFDTHTGKLLEVVPPFRVDEYIMGDDGLNYLRSGQTVMQWQLGSEGMEILQTANWNYQSVTQQPFLTRVSSQQVIWLYYGDRLIWLDLTGQILNTLSIGVNYQGQGSINHWDYAHTSLTVCSQPASSDKFNCRLYTAESADPLWEATLQGLPNTSWGYIQPDGIYAVTDDNIVYKIHVIWP